MIYDSVTFEKEREFGVYVFCMAMVLIVCKNIRTIAIFSTPF